MIDVAINPLRTWNQHCLDGDELATLSAQLRANDLPHCDIETSAGTFFDFRTERNEIAGYAGIEIFGPDGLLRSVLVLPAWRSEGVGGAIVEAMVEFACEQGVQRLHLLTMRSADFFAARGFGPLPRAEAPARIAATSEFASLCPSSAVFMRRDLRAAPALRAMT